MKQQLDPELPQILTHEIKYKWSVDDLDKNYEEWKVVLFDAAGMEFNPKFTTVCRFDQYFTEVLKNKLSREYDHELIHQFVDLIVSTDHHQKRRDYLRFQSKEFIEKIINLSPSNTLNIDQVDL